MKPSGPAITGASRNRRRGGQTARRRNPVRIAQTTPVAAAPPGAPLPPPTTPRPGGPNGVWGCGAGPPLPPWWAVGASAAPAEARRSVARRRPDCVAAGAVTGPVHGAGVPVRPAEEEAGDRTPGAAD